MNERQKEKETFYKYKIYNLICECGKMNSCIKSVYFASTLVSEREWPRQREERIGEQSR